MKTNGFTEDIVSSIRSQGADVRTMLRNGFTVLDVTGPGGRSSSLIPVSSFSRTEEEAAENAARLESLISSMPDRPLVVARDRWETRRDTIQKRIIAHCGIFTGIFARNCEARRIEKPEAKAFLDRYHSYGSASCRYCYGLYISRYSGNLTGQDQQRFPAGTLVAVAVFSNARKWAKDGKEIRSYEWIRYASLPETRVTGGMGKLLKAFIRDIHPDDIMSYADLEWSDGSVYTRLGFMPDGKKTPVMFRIDTGTWRRIPASADITAELSAGSRDNTDKEEYFMNSGSLKYRLKLTDY